MQNRFKKLAGKLAAGVIAGMMMVGCSGNSPMAPESRDGANFKGGNTSTNLAAQVEFASRVATTDAVQRKLTFTSNNEIVFAASDAEIVRRNGNTDTPISFSEIAVGDSVEIRGNRQSDNSVLADRIRVKSEDNNNEIEFGGRVSTLDASTRAMTLVGDPRVIHVADNAEVMNQDLQVQIDLSEIVPGDSVEIRGVNQPDGSVLADRVRLRQADSGDTDLEFRGRILSIDYGAGSFTVSGRTESILVDAATVIYAKLSPSQRELGKQGHDDNGDLDSSTYTPLSFTDLQLGDSVEVHANIIDASTLKATAIELEDADGILEDIEFKATIASIDPITRTVTFTGQNWVGTVSETALLTGFNYETIALTDFPVGQLVEVKGFPGQGDALEVVRMHKENNL